MKVPLLVCLALCFIPNPFINAREAKLFVGWAIADITPDKPVALVGQLHKRISESVQDPLTATALAIETIDDRGNKEQAIMISCDLIFIRAQTQRKLQTLISKKLSGFDASRLFLNATHTHTAPGLIDDEFFDLYDVSKDIGVMKPSEYELLFLERTLEAASEAWNKRKPAGFSWCLGNAVLGHNRRTVKFDGSAKMYGVHEEDFSHYEGKEDSRVGMLFFWDMNQKLTGMVINVASTAQVTDGTSFISADLWHETRVELRKKYGNDLFIFPQIGSAGDVTPINHEFIYKRAEEIMLKRKGITARQEAAERIVRSVEEVMPFARYDIQNNVIFKHTVAKIELPAKEPPAQPFYTTDDITSMEFHVIRLGDIAIATNPFELFMDYGLLIKARSKAILTFLVQLSCQNDGYLPTERAIRGGGYSADKYIVGPEGGYKLIHETVSRINEMWSE